MVDKDLEIAEKKAVEAAAHQVTLTDAIAAQVGVELDCGMRPEIGSSGEMMANTEVASRINDSRTGSDSRTFHPTSRDRRDDHRGYDRGNKKLRFASDDRRVEERR